MQRFAFVVGIDEYQSIMVPRLSFAVADASSIARQLQLPGPFGVPQATTTLLLNGEASRESMIEGLNRLTREVGTDDFVIFYFAGHGASEVSAKGDSDDKLAKYIVPYDVDLESLDSSAIDHNFLAERINKIKARNIVLIFDCCYSGAAGGRTVPLRNIRSSPLPVGTRYLERFTGSGRIIFTACNGTEVAQERRDLSHGVFTHFLLEGLKGRADYKRDHKIDVEELWMYAQAETIRATEGTQSPVRDGRVQGDPIVLTHCTSRESTDERKVELGQLLVERFPGLRDLIIADGEEPELLAVEAARYLASRIRNNMKIAVSCGRTLIETISQLPRLRVSKIEIFPLNGSPTDEVRLTDSMVLTYLLWSRFDAGKARAHVVPTGIPQSMFEYVQDNLSALAQQILEQAKDADMFLFGIGSPSRKNQNIEYLFKKAGVAADELQEIGAVGEINFHLYDESGTLLGLRSDLSAAARRAVAEYSSKFFSLSVDALSDITRRPGIDLVVVAGGFEKRQAIQAAIRGGFARTLVTDLFTAEWLSEAD